jgi:hypothetical protein
MRLGPPPRSGIQGAVAKSRAARAQFGGGLQTRPLSIWAFVRNVLSSYHERGSCCGIVQSSRTFVTW